MGNLTLKVNRLGHRNQYNYDELNRLISEKDSLCNITEYAYDAVGNRIYKKDPNGTESSYTYYDNYLVKKIAMTNGFRNHSIEYAYDEAGYQQWVRDGNVTTSYNTYNGNYTPDSYGRIYRKTENIIITLLDALDLENSVYSEIKVRDIKYLAIKKYALQQEKVRGFNFVRLKKSKFSTFVSEFVRNKLVENNITGCDFLEVKVV